MIPHHLTFQTRRDALCPTCNQTILTGCWTIRAGVALCLRCAETIPDNILRTVISLAQEHGAAHWTVSRDVLFFTPDVQFPAQELWHIWYMSGCRDPRYGNEKDRDDFTPHTEHRQNPNNHPTCPPSDDENEV